VQAARVSHGNGTHTQFNIVTAACDVDADEDEDADADAAGGGGDCGSSAASSRWPRRTTKYTSTLAAVSAS
jgi:hypothetical protein